MGAPGMPTAVQPRQYSRTAVLSVWAAAAVPMGLLAWVAAPAWAGPGADAADFARALIAALTVGLVWQFGLVVALVGAEQRSLRWRVLRDALWLRAPSDATGRRGGRLWLWALVGAVAYAGLLQLPLAFPAPSDRNLEAFLDTAEGQDLFGGNWALYALVVVMLVFNTVLGEELLLRGLLLPRMQAAFGRADWVVNGVLGGIYHLHQPWMIPQGVVTHTLFAYSTRRFRSAWMGIVIHSAASVFFVVVLFALVAG